MSLYCSCIQHCFCDCTLLSNSNQLVCDMLQCSPKCEPICVCTAHGGGWGYSASSVEAIRFSPDTDVLLGGFGLYGGRGTYNAEIKVRTDVVSM